MIGNYQRYEATVKFAFETEVFPGDPDDLYELAALEAEDLKNLLERRYADVVFDGIEVNPITIALA